MGLTSTNNGIRLIDSVNSPEDLRKLSREQLPQLCQEAREDLISTLSQVGGHFASSLGATELTVGLHWVLNTPKDRIVWDTGHQAYIHKMLTGRKAKLPKIRKLGGISGFPKRDESNYDSFGVAHAGTSVSAAAGMIEASFHEYDNRKDRKVVAVIGDGAMTSGMVFEALNHAGQLGRNLIVILNDNEMSIAPNVGALSDAFSKTLTNKYSTSVRRKFKEFVERGYIPEIVYSALDRAEEAATGFFSAAAMLFTSFGFRYLGPIDGHNIEEVINALERAIDQDCPVLIHANTIKGKGYAPAEKDPVSFHGVGPFNIQSGGFKKSNTQKAPSYTKVFGDYIVELAKEDPRIVAITAAMPDGTGLNKLKNEMPERYFDVGIGEQHAVTFAAGLACEGMKPVVTIYSTFLQRAFDQIEHDVCIQSLPVIFAMDRAGLVGADGATHHGVFDISYLRCLPNMTIMAPKDELELKDMLYSASLYENGPIAIRYPRGEGLGEKDRPAKEIKIGKAETLIDATKTSSKEKTDVLIIAYGNRVSPCIEVAHTLSQYGIEASLINARFVKPLDEELFKNLIPKHSLIVTVEDHVISGGFGSAVLEFMAEENLFNNTNLLRIGIPDKFIDHGTQDELYNLCKIDANGILNTILNSSYIKENLHLKINPEVSATENKIQFNA